MFGKDGQEEEELLISVNFWLVIESLQGQLFPLAPVGIKRYWD